MKIRVKTERHDDESFALKFYADRTPEILDPRAPEPPRTPPRIIRPNAPEPPRTIIRPDRHHVHGYIYLADGSMHSVLDPVPDDTRIYLGGLISRTVL